MGNWKVKVSFRDLLDDYDDEADELLEIKRIKPLWVDRFNTIPELKHFVKDIKNLKTESQFNKFLNNVYDYCDYHSIWINL